MKLFKKNKPSSPAREAQTDSKNKRVYTYYTASKSQIDKFERSNKERNKKPVNYIEEKLGSKLMAVVFISLLGALAVFMLVISAKPVVVFDGSVEYRTSEEYSKQVSEVLAADKRNFFKFSLQSDKAEADIKERIPEATEVKVSAPFIGRGAVVKITTAEPFAVLIQPGAPSYVIDSSGAAVIDITETSIDTSKLSTIKNESGINYTLADQVFKPEEMQALADLNYQLTDGAYKVISYNIPPVPREIRVDRAGYYVKFSLDDSSGADTKIQYGSLISIENSIAKQGTQKPSEYIDVRLGDKVYIK